MVKEGVMNNADYKRKKLEYSYRLTKNRKFFQKARAIIVEDKKLFTIEVTYLNGVADDLARNDNRKAYNKHYLLPGGGIDEGETVKVAVAREAFEEYGIEVEPIKYLGKQYYNVPMNLDGEDFVSHRVEYYYLCTPKTAESTAQFGIEGEFTDKNKVYKKVKLSYDDVKALDPSDLNDMNKDTYNLLLEILK